MISFFKLSVSVPQRRYSEHLHRLWSGGIDFDISIVKLYLPVEWTGVLNVELVVLKLQDLVFVHIVVGVLFQEWFDRGLKDSCTRVIQPTERHQV